MDFSERLRAKIAVRQAGPSPRALAKAEQERHLRQHFAPLIEAIEAMRDRLGGEPLFADVIGHHAWSLEVREDQSDDGCTLRFPGRLGDFTILASATRDRLNFRIRPDIKISDAINCFTLSYTPDSGIKGRQAELDAFLAAIEDHIADFIADVATSPAAATLLSKRPSVDGRGFGV